MHCLGYEYVQFGKFELPVGLGSDQQAKYEREKKGPYCIRLGLHVRIKVAGAGIAVIGGSTIFGSMLAVLFCLVVAVYRG